MAYWLVGITSDSPTPRPAAWATAWTQLSSPTWSFCSPSCLFSRSPPTLWWPQLRSRSVSLPNLAPAICCTLHYHLIYTYLKASTAATFLASFELAQLVLKASVSGLEMADSLLKHVERLELLHCLLTVFICVCSGRKSSRSRKVWERSRLGRLASGRRALSGMGLRRWGGGV